MSRRRHVSPSPTRVGLRPSRAEDDVFETPSAPLRTPMRGESIVHSIGRQIQRTAGRNTLRKIRAVLAANGLLIALVCGVVLFFYTIEQFVRPIAWALLSGAALFPLKRYFRQSLEVWLDHSSVPLTLRTLRLPGLAFRNALEWAAGNMYGLSFFLVTLIAAAAVEPAWYVASKAIASAPDVARAILEGIHLAWTTWTTLALPTAGIGALFLVPLLLILRLSPKWQQYVVTTIWALCSIIALPLAVRFLPSTLVAVIFVPAVAIFLVGLFSKKKVVSVASPASGSGASTAAVAPPKHVERDIRYYVSTAYNFYRRVFEILFDFGGGRNDNEIRSRSSIIVIFMAIGCFGLVLKAYVPVILLIAYCIAKINDFVDFVIANVSIGPSFAVLFPPPVADVFRLFSHGDDTIRQRLRAHVDAIASLLTLLVFIAGTTVLFAYFTITIFDEGKSTALSAKVLLEDPNFGGVNSTVAKLMERVVDWAGSELMNITGVNSTLIAELQKGIPLSSEGGFTDFVKNSLTILRDSFNMLRSFGDLPNGPWATWLMHVATILSAAVRHTTGFLFSLIVFLTTLFYLLVAKGETSAQQDQYVVFSAIQTRLDVWHDDQADGLVEGLIHNIENIFHSTIMVSAFHGLFTWLTFSLLGARWVSTSTMLSMILATLPFVGAYWVAVPATIDLLARSQNAGPAVALMSSHLIVYMFVDPIIYAEVAGSHPYLTALAVVGGLYRFGVEGIIIGPLIVVTFKGLLDLIFIAVLPEEVVNNNNRRGRH